MTFNGPISDVSDGSPLSLQVNFRTQTGSTSFVNLNAGGTFTGPVTLAKGPNVSAGNLTIDGVLASGGGLNVTSTPGSGQLAGGNYAGTISLDTNTTSMT